ncbi:DeoR/GlpR transcriptional regulator [Sinorhizobium meliloti WSM1022]|jgi:DeoR/GlpR family transcriptional regulator of sugar metabolism|uniref:DeoR/GlpR family DNA-binding transcription regulator n=1 Tax=Rhizobium meliloti TaxID=382 RepID=UPI0004144A92|nr:DeoR/GlpR family DNA-binding transcription regulator [Sinorhizobium meliloti]ASQ03431.1 DeoR/GlpR transcriptional regulator [Sinorhizobium meliloti]MCO6425774.1 DeoR/GlpR family DNA-binding transcription regulator [Sinorhizobium meliloti]MDW9408371.1 DeoR family transcriptional regulator [Sinorhizobium meliloti]MDW9442597.1 DeoR family transcriptional regulator [Sinorhizobium meliloti]MDW9453266.1 DeoR family transcriptional regulator [Sinorhizobium meliloti]
MKPEDRRQAIMDVLMEAGTASVEELALRFGVSKMTVHRDLDDLEQAGLLRKVHGGASIQSSPQFESDFRYREKIATGEKRRLAEHAATLIEPGQSIIIDDSSTAGAIAGFVRDIRPLTVITNNLGVIADLSGAPGINLIALGGHYSKKFNGFFGVVTEEALRSLRADVAFLSSSAIEGASAFHQDQEVVQIKRQMVKSASRKYLLVDHGKFGRSALHFLTGLTAFDAVLTGNEVSEGNAAALGDAGVKLVRIDVRKVLENA